jgi:16S rRNA processing protein RimM
MDRDRVAVADVLRPRGNCGEVLAKSQTDVPGRLENLKCAMARLADGSDVAVEIAQAWVHKSNWVLKFSGIDSMDAAERFRHAEIWLPSSDRGVLPEGEFFQSDIIGSAVVDSAGELLGFVEAVQQYGGPPLMQLRLEGREVLIPFVNAICREVDLTSKTITVDLPQGLLEL